MPQKLADLTLAEVEDFVPAMGSVLAPIFAASVYNNQNRQATRGKPDGSSTFGPVPGEPVSCPASTAQQLVRSAVKPRWMPLSVPMVSRIIAQDHQS